MDRASRFNRTARYGDSLGNVLIATVRRNSTSCARYTTPMPPRPTSCSIVNLSKRRSGNPVAVIVCSIRADAQAECEYRNQREAGLPQQSARTVTQVLPEFVSKLNHRIHLPRLA